MNTIVKALNAKVENGKATNVVDALKQIDSNAKGETIAEVIENMEIGGGSGGGGVKCPSLTVSFIGDANIQFDYTGAHDNGRLCYTYFYGNAPTTVKLYVIGNELEENVFEYRVTNLPINEVESCTDLVNCTVVNESREIVVYITDPSEDASLTINTVG